MTEKLCSSCGAAILWTETEQGRPMPVDATPTGKGIALIPLADGRTRSRVIDVYVSHFATCPNAAKHRKR